MSSKEIEKTRDDIVAWLTEEGLFKEQLMEENLHFQIAAEYPAKSGRHLSVIQPKGHEDMVVVFSRIKLMEVIRENFKCELYVVWKFQEIFGEGQMGKVSGPPEPMYI